jgi:hypothetical protein
VLPPVARSFGGDRRQRSGRPTGLGLISDLALATASSLNLADAHLARSNAAEIS